MNIESLASIISSIGFPIVMAGALFWFINEQRKSHLEETQLLQKSIERNTEALSELKGLINAIIGKVIE